MIGRISLSELPVPLFGTAMGIQGAAVVLSMVADRLRPAAVTLSVISLMLLVAVAVAHVFRAVRHRDRVVADLRNPAMLSFYAQPAVTLLLAAEIFTASTALGTGLAAVGAVIAVLVAVGVMAAAKDRPPGPAPAQLIPWIAVLMLPITLHTHMGEVWSWLSLGFAMAGVIGFYLAVSTTSPLPAPLFPTTMIHLAVPSVVCVDLAILVPDSTSVDMALGVAVFVLVGRFLRLRALIRSPFGLSWWAFTMPVSAFVLAAATVIAPESGWWGLVWAGAVVNVAVVVWVSFRTVAALCAGTLIPVHDPALDTSDAGDVAGNVELSMRR